MKKDKEYYESLDKRTKEYKEWKVSQSKGLGDYVEDLTKATGIKDIVGDCEGCNKRKEQLNHLPNYLKYLFKRNKPNEFTENDITLWKEFKERENKAKIDYKQQQLIIRLLKDVLNMSVKGCSTCSPKVWIKYIDMIDYVYDKQVG